MPLSATLDDLVFGGWLWRRRARRALAVLERTLDAKGESSLEVRHATETVRRLERCARYLGQTKPGLLDAAEIARLRGAPLGDLRVLLLSGDLVEADSGLCLMRSRLRETTSALVLAIGVASPFTALYVVTNADMSFGETATMAVFIVAFYVLVIHGWSAYSLRLWAARSRSWVALVEAYAQHRRAPAQFYNAIPAKRARSQSTEF